MYDLNIEFFSPINIFLMDLIPWHYKDLSIAELKFESLVPDLKDAIEGSVRQRLGTCKVDFNESDKRQV